MLLCRSFHSVILLLLLTLVSNVNALGQQSSPSLQEVKAIGASRSSYQNHQPIAIDGEKPEPNLADFRSEIEPILRTACFDCHGSDTQEAELRVDTLNPDLIHGGDVNWWLEVMDVLGNGEMPPEGEADLSNEQRSRVIDWLSRELQVASQVRRNEKGHSSFRRLSRYEYKYALQDLLGLPYDFAADLPPETPSEDGFTNSSEVLRMSTMQLEYYRELGRVALMKATVRGEQPKPIHYAITFDIAAQREHRKLDNDADKIRERLADNPEKLEKELARNANRHQANPNNTHFLKLDTEERLAASWRYSGARYAWDSTDELPKPPAQPAYVAVIPARQKLIVELGNQLPDSGILRVRIRAARRGSSVHPPSLRLEFGWQASNNSSASERLNVADVTIEATADEPQFYQWDIPLSEIKVRNPMRKTAKMGETPSPSEYIQFRNTSLSDRDLQIDYVEITTPYYDQWPPESHASLFSQHDSEDERASATAILKQFMTRAWRRTITKDELKQKLDLYDRFRPQCDNFQETMIEVLSTVLASPMFLYLEQSELSDGASPPPNDFELATRLALFLWCSVPDQELLDLAAANQLGRTETLAAQTERMLDDPKSQRFARHFVRQWLGMQLLDYLKVDKKAYPRFDESLKEAMQEEPIALFREVLKNNHSVLDFIHADYVVVNERLAKHYGLDQVLGNHFQRVDLPNETQRGGLITQAGLLAMNSDGVDSHPLKRGIWMLESLLNDPPPPPPPAVPEIDLADPEIAKMTLKERIEDHRNDPACMSCHAKIDPWGIAFENFDAVGRWRTEIKGAPVDASSRLFNQQELDGVEGLKRFLLASRQDQFVRTMVHKLATFALGRPLKFTDRSQVDQITADLRRHQDGLATLMTLMTTSDLFRSGIQSETQE